MEHVLREMHQWVREYIKAFYTDDAAVQPMILVKEEHTKYVVEISRALAASLGLNARDCLLAEMIGLFHDIGRFKQYTLYQTFNDRISEDHARLGLKEIEDLALLQRLTPEELEIFQFAIANHNAMCITPTDDVRRLLFAKIIRDADKLDIYRVLAPLLHSSDGSGCNPGFMDCFLRGEQCDYTQIQTHDDQKLVRLLWMYDINFGWTMRQIMERGYADEIIKYLPEGEATAKGARRLRAYMGKKARED